MSLVALIDGPLSDTHPAFGGFIDLTGGAVFDSPAGRHAAAMASAIAEGSPAVRILSIAVFAGPLAARADRLAEALAVAGEHEAAIVHCSLGLARYDPVIDAAVASLVKRGRIVVASAAARGGPVWPAALDDVIAVQGDARCEAGEWSRLGLPTADYGASPRLAGHPQIAGASVAAAHLTGLLAARGCADQTAARAMLIAGATFEGREHRFAEGPSGP